MCVHFVREQRLLFDHLDVWEEFAERKILLRPRGPAERGQRLRIADHEELSHFGVAGLEEDFGQPSHRGERFVLEPQRLFAVDDEEGIARHGIERLDPTVEENGETAEFFDRETVAHIVPKKRRDDVERGREQDEPEDEGGLFHRAFLTKPKRCMENCKVSPSATRPQAM